MEKRKRREVLIGMASAGAGIVLAAIPANGAGKKPKAKKEEERVSPGEDLMREHGVLNRVLLIYDETTRRLAGQDDPNVEVVTAAAALIRRFIEGYHEKLEETQLFPRFEKAGKLVELVTVLRRQHTAGRKVTDEILKLAVSETVGNAADRTRLAESLRKFVRMYRPHEAREDTVLFPAFHELVGQKEYERLGEQFEDKEHELLGESGFEKAVAEVAQLEQALGIFDLAKFTPQ
jgi:hemerythrin-like domain-containing protein